MQKHLHDGGRRHREDGADESEELAPDEQRDNHSPRRDADLSNPLLWWRYVGGACWRQPCGPGTSIGGRGSHPVVHIAYEDAAAYAAWAGKDLPTEAEWEFAARGGLDGAEYCWGDDYKPGGKPMTNTWQGEFPWQNLLEDGYEWTAPVGSFAPNGYGLYDMAGNVWQWVADWYRPDTYRTRNGDPRNPRGPGSGTLRIVRGGSWVTHDVDQLRCAHRHKVPPDTYAYSIGFRVVYSDDGTAETL